MSARHPSSSSKSTNTPPKSFSDNYNKARANDYSRESAFAYATDKEIHYVCTQNDVDMHRETRDMFVSRVTSRFMNALDAGDTTQGAIEWALEYARKLLNEYEDVKDKSRRAARSATEHRHQSQACCFGATDGLEHEGRRLATESQNTRRGYDVYERVPRSDPSFNHGVDASRPSYSYWFEFAFTFTPASAGRRYTSSTSDGRYRTEERRPASSVDEINYSRSYTSANASSRTSYTHTSSAKSGYRTEERRPSSTPHNSYSSSGSNSTPREPTNGITPPVCLYKVLGISRTADADEVRKAYRKLSLKYHPDRAGDGGREAATQKMAELNQANDVLGDEKKRRFYDRTGKIPGLTDKL